MFSTSHRSAPGRRWALAALLWLVATLPGPPIRAHDFRFTESRLLLRADGSYQWDLRVDVDALALGVSSSTEAAEVASSLEALGEAEFREAVDRARTTLARRLRIRFDGTPVAPSVSFPPLESAAARDRELPSILGLTARLEGPIPESATTVSVFASRSFGPLHLTILDERRLSGVRQVLSAGERSPPYSLSVEGAAASAGAPPPVSGTLVRYLRLGFEHILPLGLDHILFVLGLFLLSREIRPLLIQITAFTVAHTATLALSIYGVISLPSVLVETLIALSIAYVGFENVATDKLHPWRPLLVFGFGLLHGLGFAGVLLELGLPREAFVGALIAFNVGVELGQLAVVLLALALVGRLRNRPSYRSRVVIPASIAIGLVGLYWAFERALG